MGFLICSPGLRLLTSPFHRLRTPSEDAWDPTGGTSVVACRINVPPGGAEWHYRNQGQRVPLRIADGGVSTALGPWASHSPFCSSKDEEGEDSEEEEDEEHGAKQRRTLGAALRSGTPSDGSRTREPSPHGGGRRWDQPGPEWRGSVSSLGRLVRPEIPEEGGTVPSSDHPVGCGRGLPPAAVFEDLGVARGGPSPSGTPRPCILA